MYESEKLKKETTQKENFFLIQSADAALLHTKDKLAKAEATLNVLDQDILLLQKSQAYEWMSLVLAFRLAFGA